MKLNSIKRIVLEDFGNKYQDLLPKLLFPLNTFIENTVSALTNNLTLQDNFAAQVKEIDFTAPINASNTISFKSTLKSPCTDIWVSNIQNTSSPGTPPTGAPFCTFSNSGTGQIQITNITGLTDGQKYKIRLICLS